jgi:hypothetical protein
MHQTIRKTANILNEMYRQVDSNCVQTSILQWGQQTFVPMYLQYTVVTGATYAFKKRQVAYPAKLYD